MPFLNDSTLDDGLNDIADNCDAVFICSALPATYAEATATYALGSYDFGAAGTAFGAPAAGSPSGRAIASVAVTVGQGSITAAGSAAFWASVDNTNSQLKAANDVEVIRTVGIGDTFSLASFNITTPDP